MYMNEVATQAKVMLYILVMVMNSKVNFFAGRLWCTRCVVVVIMIDAISIEDPVKCVEEKLGLRFEEIKSVVYKLRDGSKTVPKPLRLLILVLSILPQQLKV